MSVQPNLVLNETLPVRGKYEILVAGGGVAGVAAALSARRAGRRVLLIEKTVAFGGLATTGLINLFVPMCNGRGKQIIFGLAEELLQLSLRYGWEGRPAAWRQGEPQEPTDVRYVARYSPWIFALTLAELLKNEGVDVLLDCLVTRPIMEQGRCRGVVLESKSGREFYETEMVIDATGDADLLFRAGVPTVQGRNFFTYAAKKVTLETARAAYESGDIAKIYGGASGGGANLYGGGHPEGMKFYTGTSVEDVTEYLMKNQLLLLEKLKGEDRQTRDIAMLPFMAQYRTTRCIAGDYTLKEEDHYRHFADSVGAIGDFERRDFLYEIPFRTLVRTGFDNLITAGRSAAAEGYAWDVLRVIPPAIITGQAAGLAAALALDSGRPIPAVDLPELQRKLAEAKVLIHFDDALIPADPNAPAEAGEDIGHF